MSKITNKSPISLLDEFCKRKIQPAASYTFSSNLESDFTCTVNCFNETMTAKAKSKKQAKHFAAQNLIKHFKTLESFKFDLTFLNSLDSVDDTEVSSSTSPNQTTKRKSMTGTDGDINYIGKLLEFCIKTKLPPATFEFIDCSGLSHLKEFHMKCRVNDIERDGKGFSKKEAKKIAAMKVLKVLTEEKSESNTISDMKAGEEPSLKKLKEDDNGSLVDSATPTIERTESNVIASMRCDSVLMNAFFAKIDCETKSKGLILLSNTGITNEERLQLLFEEFNFKNDIVSIADANYKLHITQGDFDLEITGAKEQLYEKALSFFTKMALVNYELIRSFIKLSLVHTKKMYIKKDKKQN